MFWNRKKTKVKLSPDQCLEQWRNFLLPALYQEASYYEKNNGPCDYDMYVVIDGGRRGVEMMSRRIDDGREIFSFITEDEIMAMDNDGHAMREIFDAHASIIFPRYVFADECVVDAA